jgi:hypothetical protein
MEPKFIFCIFTFIKNNKLYYYIIILSYYYIIILLYYYIIILLYYYIIILLYYYIIYNITDLKIKKQHFI